MRKIFPIHSCFHQRSYNQQYLILLQAQFRSQLCIKPHTNILYPKPFSLSNQISLSPTPVFILPQLFTIHYPYSYSPIKSIIMLQQTSKFIIQKPMSLILYQDSQVTIYPELLVIKKYYFPLATSKTILISDIERVGLYSSEGVAHRWGVCSKYLNNWFPYDGNRKNKTKFIEIIIKGGKTRPSITPDDPDAAFKIIWENFTKEGRDYVEHQSQMEPSVGPLQDGNQTELARQEMMKEETSTQAIQNPKKSPKEMIKVEAVEE